MAKEITIEERVGERAKSKKKGGKSSLIIHD
jgi:hypothetical protein